MQETRTSPTLLLRERYDPHRWGTAEALVRDLRRAGKASDTQIQLLALSSKSGDASIKPPRRPPVGINLVPGALHIEPGSPGWEGTTPEAPRPLPLPP